MPPSSNHSIRIVILISGRGSNMQSLVETIKAENLPVDVSSIISNKKDAEGIKWAKENGLPTKIIANNDYASRDQFDLALLEHIQTLNPDYILLAGFMRVLGESFVHHFNGKIINIHPSLLPLFPGLNTHAKALASGVSVHGCSLHFVTPVLDDGPIIAQGIVPISADDTPDILAKRLLPVEHAIYCQVLRWLAEDRISLDENGKVTVKGVQFRVCLGKQLIDCK